MRGRPTPCATALWHTWPTPSASTICASCWERARERHRQVPDAVTTEVCLARIEAALADADATLSTGLGDHQELTCARLWRGQVLVDWEPDPLAGGCLLRPALLRRLIALRARVEERMDGLVIHAPGRIVTALSPQHAGLVRQLGGAPRVELSARLRIEDDQYV